MRRNNGSFVSLNIDFKNFDYSYYRKVYNVAQVGNEEAVLNQLAIKYAELIDPWVPYDKGQLSQFQIEDGGKIVYDPIANNKYHYHYGLIQYTTNFPNRKRSVHRKATDHWDEYANMHIWDSFRKEAAKIIKAQLKKENK